MIRTAAELTRDETVTADVCVIGTGAGGAVLAAGLAERGLKVVLLEEGGHHTSKDFRRLEEGWSLPNLYQERGGRATADQAITVLQGRSVGGGTTVNWTTCFRTPPRILEHWREVHRLTALSEAALAPHFDAVEARLGIARWDVVPPNPNNASLLRGSDALGWEASRTARNVRECQNSGYCGYGCPFDAKQGMLLTYLPDALDRGAELLADVRAERLVRGADGRITEVQAVVMRRGADRVAGPKITVKAERFAVCGGAINSPALLLRSGLDQGPVGKRTWLHPVVLVVGAFDERIDGWYGAPQTVTSHEFIDRGPGEIGFFLEVAPVSPMLGGSAVPGFGPKHTALLAGLAHATTPIAITVDGLLPDEVGGTVTVASDGRTKLDYAFSPAHPRAFAAGVRSLAEVMFAAGARRVITAHSEPVTLSSPSELATLDGLRYGAHEHAIFSAHQMGGCAMGPDPATSVVDEHLRHHHVPNLFVVDGSVLPTALGVNPSETIYGIARWAVDGVAAG